MNKKCIITKDYRGTTIIFSQQDSRSATVVWQIDYKDVVWEYNLGTIEFKQDVTEKQMDTYCSSFMWSDSFFKAKETVVETIREQSTDEIEKEAITKCLATVYTEDNIISGLELSQRDDIKEEDVYRILER